ncbi:hypothetical protein Nepgr_028046 [Nepenthes gracilis]|uniref:non-specific serine/threonine protein kinase n=1 Tax=Nepenthes gracilis TaxID=150966 RepID=A0AAD3Y215_NEPGR|nr:hypothetical protein Nepgr_028046 [Nepenthes gracilis]
MATTTPSPNPSPSAVPSPSTSTQPDSSTSQLSPSVQPNGIPPESSTSEVSSPPPKSPLPAGPATPPAAPPPAISTPPPPPSAPPPTSPRSPPPVTTPSPPPSPPPVNSSSPPPAPSKESPAPPPPSSSPTSSPPPPSSSPTSSPPPPSSSSTSSPPPSPQPPSSNPPSSTAKTPASSPPTPPTPPPSSIPPANSPPPPAATPSKHSSPPPPPSPPKSSPSPPASEPPNSPPLKISPPPPDSQPSSPSSGTPQTPSPVSHISPSFPSPPPPASKTSNPSSAITPANKSSTLQPTSSPSNGGVGTSAVVAIGLVVGFIMFGLIGIAVWRLCKQKKRHSGLNGGYNSAYPLESSPRSDSNLIAKTASAVPLAGNFSGSDSFTLSDHGGLGHSRHWFTYQELFDATNGFSAKNLLGEGGFGCVYKGCLADGREVAVKQLKIGGGQGEREFKAEVEIISRIHHRHLVSLVGYCIFESRRLLVYEYVPNDTLHHHLHGKDRPVMDWATRIKIAAGAARGIAYLHEDCHPRIIHRDIKSSNILLDNNFEARVSDFGLAKLAMDADTHVSTRVMGTFGYLAPEYATSGKLTEKSDVYSFGVVLLELITGRKPVDATQPLGDESLVEWARPWLSHALETGKFEGLVDPRLGKNYVESEVFRMIEAAAACVRHSSTKRPRMRQVVRAFDSIATSDLNNGMRVGESQVYDSAEQSAEIRWFRRMAFGSQDFSTDFFSEPRRNIGILSPGSPSVDSSSSGNVGILSQPSQNVYYSSQNDQNLYHSSRSQDVYYSSQNDQNLYGLSQHSPNVHSSSLNDPNLFHSSQHSKNVHSSSPRDPNADFLDTG